MQSSGTAHLKEKKSYYGWQHLIIDESKQLPVTAIHTWFWTSAYVFPLMTLNIINAIPYKLRLATFEDMIINISNSYQHVIDFFLCEGDIEFQFCKEVSLEDYHCKSIATASQCHSACWVQRNATHHGPSWKQSNKTLMNKFEVGRLGKYAFSFNSFIHRIYKIREFASATWFKNEHYSILSWDF